MRCATNGKYPRFIVWENVTGAFSSNSGEDFRTVLEEICKIKDGTVSIPKPAKWSKSGEIMGDGFSIAYRTLDAQFWGVPQRRKRIYLVTDFDGECAGKVLFESEGVSGYSAKSFKAWQRASRSAENCSGTADPNLILCDQGGERMDVLSGISATLRAEAHHPPCVLSSIFEKHSQDSRYTGPLDVAPTISAKYGTGGNNQPFVVETPKTLKVRCGKSGGGKGALIQEDKSATLSCNNDQTVFVPTAYGICSKHSNAMMSDNPHSGFYEAETSRTIDTSNQSPVKNQGGMVVLEGNGSRPSHHGDGYSESDMMYTLNTVETHGVAYGIDRASFNQGKNALYDFAVTEEVEPTMVAKGPGAVASLTHSENVHYIVRRLIPQECALLQGMPTWWCDELELPEPTEEQMKFWREVFETYRKATALDKKPKSDKQILKWLKNPYSDSAAYKMWGNGIAMPCAWFVLSGIAYYAQNENK